MLSGMPAEAWAQQTRPSSEAGQIEKRLVTPERPPAEIDAVEPPEFAVPPPEVAETFLLERIEVEGATIFEAAEFSELYESFLNRQITLVDVENLLATITEKYRKAGYVLSRAVAPPQSLDEGVLRIRIIEGYVEKVVFDGDQAGGEALLASHAALLASVRPTTLAALEHTILLLNDLPGIWMRSALRPIDPEAGSYELRLTLHYDPVEGYAGLDNRGTPDVGRLQGYVAVDFNSLFGLLERTRLTFYTVPDSPDELLYFEGQHEQVLNAAGTTLTLSGSQSFIDSGADLEVFGVESMGTRISLELRHPLIRSREESLYLHGRFDYMNTDEEQLGVETFDDRLRVLRLGGRYYFGDTLLGDAYRGANQLGVEFSQGLEMLGASEEGDSNLSRFRGRGNFTKVTADVYRHQRIADRWSASLLIAVQRAAHALLSAEEFRLGGARFGRAYDPSELTGVDGAGGSLELQYGRSVEWAAVKAYQLYGFYDLGAVWDKDGRGSSLSSTGVGVRARVWEDMTANFEAALPLTRIVFTEGDSSMRFFFSLQAAF
ncbi:MAG: ShlB/FhaC/HecB family hemolysin secretion/activation protein [Alphaproteobacteria bacterium]|nr:ShlB/FhaC/HecB family hemolysin secretion/activation protein [Alphaproteobacteria bacterium]